MANTSIPVTKRTRDLVKRKKRGGETYDELVHAVFEDYNPNGDDK